MKEIVLRIKIKEVVDNYLFYIYEYIIEYRIDEDRFWFKKIKHEYRMEKPNWIKNLFGIENNYKVKSEIINEHHTKRDLNDSIMILYEIKDRAELS